MHKIIVLQQVYFMPLYVTSTCAQRQEVKIAYIAFYYYLLIFIELYFSNFIPVWIRKTN